MFVNWDAEEYGLVGSLEFIDEYRQILTDRTIAYINVDNIAHNQSM